MGSTSVDVAAAGADSLREGFGEAAEQKRVSPASLRLPRQGAYGGALQSGEEADWQGRV